MAPQIVKLPWEAIGLLARKLRVVYGTVDKPEEPHLNVDLTVNEATDVLRAVHFREDWILSFYYRGEDGSLCRPEFEADGYEDYQLHVRLFEQDDGTLDIYGHHELDPIMHPREHIQEVNYDNRRGIEMVKDILDREGIGYVEKSPSS